MQIELNGKQLSKLIELENQFAYLHKDEAAYALDKLLSCVNLISGVHILDYALRYHDKNSLLGYEYIFDDDFKELVKNTWSDLRDKSAIDSLWSLHKDNSIVLLLDGEGRGVQIQLVDSAPTHFLTSPELNNHVNSDMTANRSNGLVAFTKDHQRELLSYSEGDIRLYLEDQTFDFGVYVEYDPEFDREYFYDMIGEDFKLEGLTDEEILDICERELPAIKLNGTHSVDEIESLLETFEQNVYFYDPEQETVVGKIY